MNNEVNYNHISVIITTTYFCNMNCVYCYNNRQLRDKEKRISIDVLKKLFQITIPFYKHVHFVFHGGEPLSMGIEFYEEVIILQKQINIYETEITNSIQTNLTLLDEKFIKFLLDNKISIGSSYDGINNELTRKCSELIISKHRLLRDLGGNNGFIYVVQKNNINHLIEDYMWFKSMHIGYNHNMYLANFPFDEDPLYVEPMLFSKKMCELFAEWIYDTECDIHLRYFETIIDYIINGEKALCCYNDCIGKYIGIRYDGSIFGCNRDMPDEFSYGNVSDYNNIREAFNSEGFNNYLKQAINRRKKCIETCEIYDFCHGGCNSVALQNGKIDNMNSSSCEALKKTYSYIDKIIQELLSSVC